MEAVLSYHPINRGISINQEIFYDVFGEKITGGIISDPYIVEKKGDVEIRTTFSLPFAIVTSHYGPFQSSKDFDFEMMYKAHEYILELFHHGAFTPKYDSPPMSEKIELYIYGRGLEKECIGISRNVWRVLKKIYEEYGRKTREKGGIVYGNMLSSENGSMELFLKLPLPANYWKKEYERYLREMKDGIKI